MQQFITPWQSKTELMWPQCYCHPRVFFLFSYWEVTAESCVDSNFFMHPKGPMAICMQTKLDVLQQELAMPCHWHPRKQFLSKGCSTRLQAQPAVLNSFVTLKILQLLRSIQESEEKKKISQKSDCKWKDVERFKYLLLHFVKLTPILCSLTTIQACTHWYAKTQCKQKNNYP